MWLHNPSKEAEEYEWHMGRLVAECSGRKYALLMGSDVCRAMVDEAVSDVSGLTVNSPYLPKDCIAVACKNPAIVLRDGATVGETRLAFKKFGKLVQGERA